MVPIKKYLVLCLILLFSITVFGCSKKDEAAEDSTATEEIMIETLAPYEDKIKVALIVGDQNGSSFEEGLMAGLLQVGEELPEIYEMKVWEAGEDAARYEEYLYQAADDRMDIIISFGSFNKENFEVIPTEYPSTYFILFDEEIDYTLADLSNVLTIIFDDSQASFLAGAVAAIHSLSAEALYPKGKIGFLGTAGEDGWKDYFGGFWQGVRYVDETLKIAILNDSFSRDMGPVGEAEEEPAPLSLEDQIRNQLFEGFNSIFYLSEVYGEEFPALKVMTKAEEPLDGEDKDAPEDEDLLPEPLTAGLIAKRPDHILYKLLRDNLTEEGLPYGRTMRFGLAYDGVELQVGADFLNSLALADRQSLEAILAGLQRGEILLKTFAELTPEEQMAVLGVE